MGELDGKEEGVLHIELEKEQLFEVRESMPVFEHQRPEAYGYNGTSRL